MRSDQLYGRTAVESHHMQSMKSRTGKKPSHNIAIETKIEVMSHNGSQMDLVRTGGNTTVAECYSTEERPPAQGRSMV